MLSIKNIKYYFTKYTLTSKTIEYKCIIHVAYFIESNKRSYIFYAEREL